MRFQVAVDPHKITFDCNESDENDVQVLIVYGIAHIISKDSSTDSIAEIGSSFNKNSVTICLQKKKEEKTPNQNFISLDSFKKPKGYLKCDNINVTVDIAMATHLFEVKNDQCFACKW